MAIRGPKKADLRNTVPTLKQTLLAKTTVEFGGVPGMSRKKLRELAGYKTATNQVFKTPGYLSALAKYGLTEDLIATALVEDIKSKPRNRIHELALGADILGMRKRHAEVDNSKNLTLVISAETAERYGALPPKPVEATVIEHDASSQKTV